MKNAKVVGFIGGNGEMAKLFIPIFKSRGYKIIISDKRTPLSNQEVTHQADIVIISVPIMKTKEVIREIIPWTRKGQLLMDLTSLKSEPVHEMQKGKADVIGLHPMFGPTISSLDGQRIIMCPEQSPNKKFIQKILEEEGLNVHITTPEKHDKNMGVIQILIHFHSIMLGHTLKSLNVDLKEIEEFMSPIYRLEFGVIARIFSQDPDLYGPILMMNPEKHEILKQIDVNTKNLSNIVECSDLTLFREFFKKTSKYLGKYSEIADKMIET
ncbi:prephenate dehydrogenase/arogenate dehydrogenase family protein [Patescibacteria group bacterium]